MSEFNEESYLDSLLKKVDTNSSEQLDSRKEYMDELQKKELLEKQEAEAAQTDDEHEEELIKQQVWEANKKIEEGIDDDFINSDEEDDVKAIVNDNYEPFKAKEVKDDYVPIKELTESDLERLKNMELDSIIKDVHEENNDDLKKKTPDNKTESEINKESASNDSINDAKPKEKQSANENINNQDDSKKDKKNKKDKKDKKKEKLAKRDKNKKKGLLTALRHIFFEDIEEEVNNTKAINELGNTLATSEISNTKKKSSKKLFRKRLKGKKDKKKAKETSKEIDALKQQNNLPDNTENVSDLLNDEENSENSRVLQELYGESNEKAKNQEKKKGFLANIRYKIKEKIRLNKEAQEEEDKAEEKIAQEKAEKKQAKKEKKDAQAQAKKEAAAGKKKEKKEKKEKNKKTKVKKEKEPPKPGDILRIRPKSILTFILFITGVIILIVISNYALNYKSSVESARMYIQNGDYKRAYEKLDGLKLKKNDEQMYKEAQLVMYIQSQYTSYQINIKNHQEAKALDNLIKGLKRYNSYYNDAKDNGVASEYDKTKTLISDALRISFGINDAKAAALVVMSDSDFTQYYNTLQTYER